jgi:lipoic acid synthetase
VAALNLRFAVLTSVNRDDLPDGGAAHFAETVRRLKAVPALRVEALTPDFRDDAEALRTVARAGPDVFGNNLETVRRLTPAVRDPRAGYDQTLAVLADVKRGFPRIFTKSSLMVGLGEEPGEVEQAMRDLRSAGVDVLTVGQYLRPSAWHLPVVEWITPAAFAGYRALGERLGFRHVASGPLVRSSYRAAELFARAAPEIELGHDARLSEQRGVPSCVAVP